MTAVLPWFALGLLAAAIVAAFGAIAARSLFVTAMHLVAAGASVAAMVLVLGGGEGSLATALFAAAWAPVLLMAAMLLSARATRQARGRVPWLSMLGALVVAGAVWWPLAELAPMSAQAERHAAVGLGFWIAPILLAAATACLGLLGYGERGAIGDQAQ